MLGPISHIASCYIGPAPVDIATAVETYADKLAGRRRRLDMSMTTLSVATLRDVDDTVRALGRAAEQWLVGDPLAAAEVLASSARSAGGGAVAENTPAASMEHESEASDSDEEDDDDLIITASAAPHTSVLRRSAADIAAARRVMSFTDMCEGSLTALRGPSVPCWDEMMAAAEALTAARHRHDGVVPAAIDDAGGSDLPSAPSSSSPPPPLRCFTTLTTIDLSNTLDADLFDTLAVERFDETGKSKSDGYVSGLRALTSEEACCWPRGTFGGGLGGEDATSTTAAIIAALPPVDPTRIITTNCSMFPMLSRLDLSYTRVSCIDALSHCATLTALRLVNTIGVTRIPTGLTGLVAFEADRCFTLVDIYEGLSGLQHLELISIDEAFRVRRLPTRLPALVQMNLTRADGLCHPDDVGGATFADPLNYPALEELFIHAQRTIKRLRPCSSSAQHKEGLGGDSTPRATTATTHTTRTDLLPKLQVVVASESAVEGLDDALAGHPALVKLTLGPQCAAIPPNLSALTNLDISDCQRVTSLAPIVGSSTLEALAMRNTEHIPALVDGAPADVYVGDSDDDDEHHTTHADAEGTALGDLAILRHDAANVPAFPNLITFDASGSALTSIRPLANSAFLDTIDISYTRHIKTVPTGLTALRVLNTNYSHICSVEALDGSPTLQHLMIAYTSHLRCLPPLPAIERINDHKANFFLKMYVVANLQKRGVRMILKLGRDEAAEGAGGSLAHAPMGGARHADPNAPL